MNSLYFELPAADPPRLLVVGEVVLDRYVLGTVKRVSPKAPIPVLHLNRTEERLGNAAFVAASVRALGAEAHLLSVVPTGKGANIGRAGGAQREPRSTASFPVTDDQWQCESGPSAIQESFGSSVPLPRV